MTHLSEMQWQLDQPPTRLYHIHAQLRNSTRAPLYDVPTAVDVFGTGEYPRLPKKLKVEEEVEIEEEKSIGLLRYTVMCCLLDCEEGLSDFSSIDIDEKDGFAVLEKRQQFSVHVVPLLGTEMNEERVSYSNGIKWVLLSVSLFVAQESNFSDYSDVHLEQLRRKAQQECIKGGLRGLYEFLSDVCSEMAFQLLSQQATRHKDALNLSVRQEGEAVLVINYWEKEGHIRVEVKEHELRITANGDVFDEFNFSRINFVKLVSCCMMEHSISKLRKYVNINTKKCMLLQSEYQASLKLMLHGDRWCRLFVDPKDGSVKMKLDPSLDICEAFECRVLLLFRSSSFVEWIKAYSALECKALLQSSLASLPLDSIAVLPEPPHSSVSRDAICVRYRQSQAFFVSVELHRPLDCPTLTLYELGSTLKKHQIFVTNNGTRPAQASDLPVMLREVLSESLPRKLRLLMIVKQLRDLKFQTKYEGNTVHAVCEKDLFGLFEREICVRLVSNDEVIVDVWTVFELSLDKFVGKRHDLKWKKESKLRLAETDEGRQWTYGPIEIKDGCLNALIKDLQSFAAAMEALQSLDPDMLDADRFRVTEEGCLVALNDKEVLCLTKKDKWLQASARGENDLYYESRCLPTLHRLMEGWKGSKVLESANLMSVVCKEIREVLERLQDAGALGWRGEVMLLSHYNTLVLKYKTLFAVSMKFEHNNMYLLEDLHTGHRSSSKYALQTWSEFPFQELHSENCGTALRALMNYIGFVQVYYELPKIQGWTAKPVQGLHDTLSLTSKQGLVLSVSFDMKTCEGDWDVSINHFAMEHLKNQLPQIKQFIATHPLIPHNHAALRSVMNLLGHERVGSALLCVQSKEADLLLIMPFVSPLLEGEASSSYPSAGSSCVLVDPSGALCIILRINGSHFPLRLLVKGGMEIWGPFESDKYEELREVLLTSMDLSDVIKKFAGGGV